MSYIPKWLRLGILLLVLLAGCSTVTNGTSNDGENKGEDAKGNTETNKDELTISVGSDMVSWDIHNHKTTSTEAIHVNVFDYLLMRDEKGDIQPHLAKEWKKVNDTTTEFMLEEGVTFHNGEDLTSDDVKFTLERVAKDDSLRSHGDFDNIEEVKVIDDYTFQIITKDPDPMLLSRISRQASGILPKDYIEEKGMDYFLQNPVGSGPLEFVEWKKDDKIVLKPYKDYFNGEVTDWKKVIFKAIPEDSTRVSELITGGLDIASNIPPSDWKRVEEAENAEIVNGPSNRTYLLFLRTQKDWPTSDEKVRSAIDYAINDQALVDGLLNGEGTPTLTRVNPGNLGYHEGLYGDYNYDAKKAKELLKEAGYENGLSIQLDGPTGRYLLDREVLQMVAGMLNEVGIEVEMNIMKWGPFVELRQKEDFKDGYLIALGSSFFDAGQSLEYYGSERSETINGYKNEKIDSLLEEAATSLDEEERIEKYKQIQEIANKERPILPLFQLNQFFGVNSNVDYQPRLDELIYVPNITKNN
ncbi:ABC transporter substrate-binding protein [Virgibacillus halodenitrificans]|nr:ABC transporter substrate-binding protein [Virgibacillus halodenitrificans]